MLLLRYLQLISHFGWRLANVVALLRMNLFTHRDLMAWLNQPFATPRSRGSSPGHFGLRLILDSTRRLDLEIPS
jgi:hypothetical protein